MPQEEVHAEKDCKPAERRDSCKKDGTARGKQRGSLGCKIIVFSMYR